MKRWISLSNRSARTRVWRFLAGETGEDLIEYALLTAVVGSAGVLAFNVLGAAISAAYSNWNGNIQNLWQSPPPAAPSAAPSTSIS
jgi:Flp pilus assembly pilin Flp